MKINSILFGVTLMASAFSLPTFAGHEEAGKMQVQISNQSSNDCTLEKKDVHQGKLLSPPPMSIMKGSALGFVAEQGSLRGPSIVLTYTCGANSITFRAHQHIVKVTGSKPDASVYSQKGVNLKFDASSSSVLHNRAGSLDITLSN